MDTYADGAGADIRHAVLSEAEGGVSGGAMGTVWTCGESGIGRSVGGDAWELDLYAG